MSLWLLKKPLFDFFISSFDWIFLKLADKVDMDKISDKLKNYTDQLINLE